jgi:hypothetical protein
MLKIKIKPYSKFLKECRLSRFNLCVYINTQTNLTKHFRTTISATLINNMVPLRIESDTTI